MTGIPKTDWPGVKHKQFTATPRWDLVKKVKFSPYSFLGVGPGADPGVQAVSLQVTLSHTPSGL